jgi:hypothetical protein
VLCLDRWKRLRYRQRLSQMVRHMGVLRLSGWKQLGWLRVGQVPRRVQLLRLGAVLWLRQILRHSYRWLLFQVLRLGRWLCFKQVLRFSHVMGRPRVLRLSHAVRLLNVLWRGRRRLGHWQRLQVLRRG